MYQFIVIKDYAVRCCCRSRCNDGFDDTGAKRQPNVRVKTSMMRVLGWTYDSDDTTSKTIASETEIDYDDADSPRKFKM